MIILFVVAGIFLMDAINIQEEFPKVHLYYLNYLDVKEKFEELFEELIQKFKILSSPWKN